MKARGVNTYDVRRMSGVKSIEWKSKKGHYKDWACDEDE